MSKNLAIGIFKKSRSDDSFQAGGGVRSTKPLQYTWLQKSKRRRCDRIWMIFSIVPTALWLSWGSYFAGIPHCVLHHLPGNCRSWRSCFKIPQFLSSSVPQFLNPSIPQKLGDSVSWRLGDFNKSHVRPSLACSLHQWRSILQLSTNLWNVIVVPKEQGGSRCRSSCSQGWGSYDSILGSTSRCWASYRHGERGKSQM